MLSYFPQIRDEESTYSIFSRMQFALHPPNYYVMGNLLFNNREEAGRLNFQSSFDYLCSNLPPKFTPEKFLYNNTIYPLFIPFLSTEKQEKALYFFKSNCPNRIQRWLAINIIDGKRKYIRVCKECIKDDFYIYGEPFYRRQHEIELNRICYKHKIPLYEYTIPKYLIPRKYDDYCTVLNNSKEITILDKFRKRFLDISTDINDIFALNLQDWNVEITKNKINSMLKEKGYYKDNGIKLMRKFNYDFKQYYTEEFLDYIGYNFDENSEYCWISRITRDSKVEANPLKYILLIRYLFGSFKKFYKYDKEYSTFIKGPYPCLNKICPNYHKLVIKQYKESKYTNMVIATFKCEYCGFIYTRKGPDKIESDIYSKTFVKDFGHLWQCKLKECVDNNYTIAQISKILQCSYTLAKNKVKKFKNTNLYETIEKESKNEFDSLILEEYKKVILGFLKGNPTATKKTVHRCNQKAYSYLLKYENEWLCSTIGFTKKSNNKSISKEDRMKNYWLNRDELLANKLSYAINQIKSEKIPYRRLTVYLLQQYVGYNGFNKNKERLPKCSQILKMICESTIDYQKRRVNYAIAEMLNNKTMITFNKVLNNANLWSRTSISQELLNYVDDKVKEYSYQ